MVGAFLGASFLAHASGSIWAGRPATQGQERDGRRQSGPEPKSHRIKDGQTARRVVRWTASVTYRFIAVTRDAARRPYTRSWNTVSSAAWYAIPSRNPRRSHSSNILNGRPSYLSFAALVNILRDFFLNPGQAVSRASRSDMAVLA